MTLNSHCGSVADLVSILRVIIAEVWVSKESWSGVFVVGKVIGGETEGGVIHVVVVNLLRVHGTHQVRHLQGNGQSCTSQRGPESSFVLDDWF